MDGLAISKEDREIFSFWIESCIELIASNKFEHSKMRSNTM